MRVRYISAAIAAITVLAICMGPASAAGYFDPQLRRQEAAHAVAETARAYGYAEDSAVIQAASADWWAAQSQIDEELDLLTRVVWFEAGSNWISDRQQQLVAMVVLNRIADPRFPNTMEGVVYARGQYSCASRLYSVPWYRITQRCYDNARAAAYGLTECPANVVYQSGVRHGKGLYEFHYNTYFCYG